MQAIKRLDQLLVGLLLSGLGTAAAAALAVPPQAGVHVFGAFLQARFLVGALGLALLYMRKPVQDFRKRFFYADAVIG